MKKLLFLINTLNVGGAEHTLIDIANRLAEDGFNVTVQTIVDTGYYRELLSPNVHYRKGLRSYGGIWDTLIYRVLCLLPAEILHLFLVKGKFDYEIAFLEGLPTKIISGSKNKNSQKYAWVHTDLYKYYRNKYVFGSLEKNQKCYQCFQKVICVSNDAKEGFVKRMGSHDGLYVQYNPINKQLVLQKANVNPTFLVSQENNFKFVAVGRLVDVKGFDLLVQAMASAVQLVSEPIELYIIGDGPEKDRLKQLIMQMGLQKVIHLCGEQKNPYNIMKYCDVQVISSRAEGYPLSLCECHLLGLPVISTKCSGPIEFIKESKGGILVDCDVAGLAKGIVEIVNNKAILEDMRNNVRSWSENYDPDAVYAEIESLF